MSEEELLGKIDRVNREGRRYFAQYFTSTALTGVQAMALYHIVTKSKYSDVFPKDLEKLMYLKSSSVSSLLNYLEQSGFIRREALPDDGRYTRLVPTEQTRGFEAELVKWVGDYVSSFFAGIPEGDIGVFDSVLSRMLENMEAEMSDSEDGRR